MPDYPHIERYYEDKQRLIDFGGSDNEQSIRAAFQNCLAAYCRAHRENLELVPELRAPGGVIPDGTVKDRMRLAHGYWEAKDLHDDLEAEIQSKLRRGYPNDNILFEDSDTAVLIQRGDLTMRADMGSPSQLHRIIQTFLNFVTREVEEFRRAWQQFKKDLPDILVTLREAVGQAAESRDYRAAAASYLELCHRTIGSQVSELDVQEMLIQHILTKDIFLRVFSEGQFHQENNIARQLDVLAQTFFTGTLRRETTDDLLPYYGAITAAAASIADYHEKQRFLKAIYEDFYQTYNPAAADRLGVVYTPDEVVDFIIRGADHLLQRHFGRTLASDDVQILDPAVGTGTFVTGLIDYLPTERLEYKYLNEIHANEVAILPYYIANLNIEYSYRERTDEYLEFPNLCFVDTLDNLGWKEAGATGGTVQHQPEMLLGGLSEENWIRVQEQNEKPISVIIGNPPYNDSATLWGDGGANRSYADIDRRISETYIEEGTAQKTHQYDMYKRFLRWASDRLDDDGIIAFVSNSAFLDSRQDDGFRKVVADEFSELWAIDLKGNARTSGERRRREGGNVFDNKIRVGVAIYFLVRRQGATGFRVFYHAVDDYAKSHDKVEYIRDKTLASFDFSEIAPDAAGEWLNRSNNNFANLVPLASRQNKLAKTARNKLAVFGLLTNAVKSNRDDWVYDFEVPALRDKVQFFAGSYNESLDNVNESYNPVIKWSSTLRDRFKRGERIVYNDENHIQSLWRPYVTKWHAADQALNDRLTRNHYEMFGADLRQPNKIINVCINGKDFYVLAAGKSVDYHFTGDTQCLPLYRYTAEGERVSNITEWGLRQFREHYGDEGITAEDIFAYTYAVLHDPVYRHEYAVDLRREFPRLPFYRDFDNWKRMGQELLDLHLSFESAELYPLRQVELARGRAQSQSVNPRVFLSADRSAGAIRLDERTTLTGVPESAWRYRLGSRSALEWVLDQYKEKKPRDPTIRERFNNYKFADHKERVIELLQRVCTVSVNTMDVVDDMAYWDEDGYLVVYGDRDKDEWATLGLQSMFSRPNDLEQDASWSET